MWFQFVSPLCACLLTSSSPLAGLTNVVMEWAAIVQPAIQAGRPPASSQVLHAMVQLAVYDAVVALEGGYEPYALRMRAPAGADVRAAVAAAAWRTARARVDGSQLGGLDRAYTSYVDSIPNGAAKDEGIRVGEQAAAALLALREHDGFSDVVPYRCSSDSTPVGEFEPDQGCGSQPVDVKLSGVRPFTISDPGRFRPGPPSPLTSGAYARDFAETRDYGHRDSRVRTADQTDVVYFWSENTYVHWNRNLIDLAVAKRLGVRDTARLFAMVHTASADAVLVGFDSKYAYRHWRPRTAIRRAGEDGNPTTTPDPAWVPLLNVNHPEYPSAHGFWSTALIDTLAAFFGTDKLPWTIKTSRTAIPQIIRTERTYTDLHAIGREIDDARVWAGLHWRHSMRVGAEIGRQVGKHVVENFFRRTSTAP